ncbi:MAG: type VI secretion protein ImpB, partial [Hyphomicrobiales bacterium]
MCLDRRVDWLFLDLNSYFASVEQNDRPELQGRPVAVAPVMTESTCAIATSYEAKAFGIRTGTRIYEARKLCPELVVVEARHDLYVEMHHRILREVDRHIPVEKVHSIDEMACRLLGPQRELAAARGIAMSIKQGLRERLGPCIRCSIGLAPNRYLAKVATDLRKPDGLVVLTRDDLPGPLLGLTLTGLHGIGRGMERRLLDAGIADVAALWALTPRQARRVWGHVGGERFWHALHGDELPDMETSRRSIGHSHVMATQFRPRAQARLIARRLAMKAAARMRRLDYTCARLVLGMRFEKGPRWADEMRVMRTQDTLVLLDAVERLWDRMERETTHPRVLKTGVTLLDLLPVAETPADLFAGPAAPGPATPGQDWARRTRLSFAIDTINRRYGRDTVWFGVNPDLKAPFTGTKIAFTRIPDMAEFLE